MTQYILTDTGSVIITGAGDAIVYGTPPTFIGGLPVFYPPKNPDVGAQATEQPDVFEVKFGDGYSQRGPKGINSIQETLSVNWNLLTLAERDYILTFFRERGGYLAFWYQLPNDRLLRYRCPQWRREAKTSTTWAITAQFSLVYDQVA